MRSMESPNVKGPLGLLESVVYALNRIDDSQAQRIALAVFREHIPQVRWFRNAGGIIDAEMA